MRLNQSPREARGTLIKSVWTLDLDNDMLMLGESHRNSRLPLSTIRQRGINLEDLQTYEPVPIPKVDVQDTFPPPYWDPPERELKLVDPFVQSALIRIATLDFEVVREGQRWGQSDPYKIVSFPGLPNWPPLKDTSVVRGGGVRVILSQDMENWISLVRSNYTNQIDTTFSHQNPENLARDTTYLLLSLRHVMLYNIDDKSLRYAQPESLFNGTNPPSKRAIELLLDAFEPAPLETSLHYLPAELQDMVVNNVSELEVESARVACSLGLGTPFSWKSGGELLRKVEFWGVEISSDPTEQQIWFDDCFSGVAYSQP